MSFYQTYYLLWILLFIETPTHHFERPFRPQLAAKRRPRTKLWLKSAKSQNIHLRRYYFWCLDPRTLHISTAYSDTLTHEPLFRPIHHFELPFQFSGSPRHSSWASLFAVCLLKFRFANCAKKFWPMDTRHSRSQPTSATSTRPHISLNENPSLGRSLEKGKQ